MFISVLRYAIRNHSASDEVAILDTSDGTVEVLSNEELLRSGVEVHNYSNAQLHVVTTKFCHMIPRYGDNISFDGKTLKYFEYIFTIERDDMLYINGKRIDITGFMVREELAYMFRFRSYIVMRFRSTLAFVWQTIVLNMSGVVAEWQYRDYSDVEYLFGDKTLMIQIDMLSEV